MPDSLDGKHLRPLDVVLDGEQAFRLDDALLLASANHLRSSLGLVGDELLEALPPRCATRKNPSLDNYLAELLLRTCHAPSHCVMPFEECWIRGSPQKLSTALNPTLTGAVLIGIGGASESADFRKVYDEHRAEGRRSTRSTTQVIFEEHLARFAARPALGTLLPVVEEVSRIDAQGGATSDHLYSLLKVLHAARFAYPGDVHERLDSGRKRAIMDAALAAVASESFSAYDNEATLATMVREFDAYVEYAADDPPLAESWDTEVAGRVRDRLNKPAQAQVHGSTSLITLRRTYYALRRVWTAPVTSFVMSFFFESLLQAQRSFDDMQKRTFRFERMPHGTCLLYYERQPGDILPHRGIMARMNRERRHGILIVHDPMWRSTMIMRAGQLAYSVWNRFAGSVARSEQGDCWYTPTQKDGTIANFLLNRSESFIGAPVSHLGPERLGRIFADALKS
jgi:hypothetical protein